MRHLFRRLTGAAALVLMCWSTGCSRHTEEAAVEKESLSMLVQTAVFQNRNVWEGAAANKLMSDTGITISLTSSNTGNQRKLFQYLISGTLPDILVFHGNNQMRLLMDADLLMPWNEYRDKLDNIFNNDACSSMITDSMTYMSSDTGKLLMLPVPVYSNHHSGTRWLPYLRYQAYEVADAGVPDTLEDYLTLVEKIREKSPYTVTGHITYGFSLSGEGDVYALSQVSELGYLYGLDMHMLCPLMETDVAAKETKSIFTGNSFYKRALHFYFQANQMGLLDKESRNQTQYSLQDKFRSGSVIFGSSSTLTDLYEVPSDGIYRGDAYIPVIADDMKIYQNEGDGFADDWYIAVNTLSKNKDKVCEFLNWLYDMDAGNRFFDSDASLIWTDTENAADRCPWENFIDVKQFEETLSEQTVGAGDELSRIPPADITIIDKMNAIGEENCRASWEMIYAVDENEFEKIWSELCVKVKEMGMDDVEGFYREAYRSACK